MSLARFVMCVAVACSPLASAVVPARAQDLKSKIEHAEHEISEAIHTDPSHPSANDPLSADPDLALWTLIVFVVLLAVLWKFAWGPIIGALEKREHSVADHIAEAERNHLEAKRLLSQYDQKLADAAAEVRELMEQARREAEHARQTILAEAKQSADAERNRALREIEAAADQAMESLAERSAQLAVELAGKILKSKLTSEDHARLIQEAVAKFPKASVN